MTLSPTSKQGDDEFARNILRPDNYELFDIVRDRLNARPVEPFDCIARDIGVTVPQLCTWFEKFSEKNRPRKHYQSKEFAALDMTRAKSTDLWSDRPDRQRQRIAQKARDGARAAREALAGK